MIVLLMLKPFPFTTWAVHTNIVWCMPISSIQVFIITGNIIKDEWVNENYVKNSGFNLVKIN